MPVAIRSRFLSVFFILLLITLPELSHKALADDQKTLLVYGDSLSAAFGLNIESGWVTLLQEKVEQTNPEWQVVNASISGETTAGGLSRLSSVLEQHQPTLVLLELGANDGLRGTPLKSMQRNLETMIHTLKERGIHIILFEMMIPPNYGVVYAQRFTQIFHDLGERYSLPVVPFFLDGVAGDPDLNQPDGIHPTAVAQPILLKNVWPTLQPELD